MALFGLSVWKRRWPTAPVAQSGTCTPKRLTDILSDQCCACDRRSVWRGLSGKAGSRRRRRSGCFARRRTQISVTTVHLRCWSTLTRARCLGRRCRCRRRSQCGAVNLIRGLGCYCHAPCPHHALDYVVCPLRSCMSHDPSTDTHRVSHAASEPGSEPASSAIGRCLRHLLSHEVPLVLTAPHVPLYSHPTYRTLCLQGRGADALRTTDGAHAPDTAPPGARGAPHCRRRHLRHPGTLDRPPGAARRRARGADTCAERLSERRFVIRRLSLMQSVRPHNA